MESKRLLSKIKNILETKSGLHIVTKTPKGSGLHPGWPKKGMKFVVLSVDKDRFATVTLEDGEEIGVKIDMNLLKKV